MSFIGVAKDRDKPAPPGSLVIDADEMRKAHRRDWQGVDPAVLREIFAQDPIFSDCWRDHPNETE